ncbi:MAG: DUF1704 domain-containing protein [Verrucomicrobia subdivision 3 bacterium]|nr:DUF1704 domain-containing protein [Limisphaerales bacterium]
MPARTPSPSLDAAFVEEMARLWRDNKRIHRRLPFGGLLHIDRQLPFLCVYRDPVGMEDEGTDWLVRGEASYLICSAHKNLRRPLNALLSTLLQEMNEAFGASLVLELWSGDHHAVPKKTESTEAFRPGFTVHAVRHSGKTVEALEQTLRKVRVLKQPAEVRVQHHPRSYPIDLPPLLSPRQREQWNVRLMGLEVRPIYQPRENGLHEYTQLRRRIHRGLSRGLRQAFYEFARSQTPQQPPHFHALGPRAVTRAVWDVDRRLAEIAEQFDFLLLSTPVNIQPSWQTFHRRKFERTPEFQYRPLPMDPARLKGALYRIDLDRVEDPTLSALFRSKRTELDRQLTMLMDRGTRNFLYGSLQLFEPVDDALLQAAQRILHALPGRTRDDLSFGRLPAEQYVQRAEAEIQRMKRCNPLVQSKVILTDQVASLMVSEGNMLVPSHARLPANRLNALIQHEVGTHVLTYWNARQQPLRLLASGLPGYDEMQEGLAVLSEYFAGELTAIRLRLLAGRVIAAHHLQEGRSFVETFRELTGRWEFENRAAYGVTARTYRSGGLIKDAMYLRGVLALLRYFEAGGALEPLWIGKIHQRHLPIIAELRLRQVLQPPLLIPSYTETPKFAARLERLQRPCTPLDLIATPRRRASH